MVNRPLRQAVLTNPKPLQALSKVFEALSKAFEALSNAFEALSRVFEALSRAFETPSNVFESLSKGFETPSNAFETPSNVCETLWKGFESVECTLVILAIDLGFDAGDFTAYFSGDAGARAIQDRVGEVIDQRLVKIGCGW